MPVLTINDSGYPGALLVHNAVGYHRPTAAVTDVTQNYLQESDCPQSKKAVRSPLNLPPKKTPSLFAEPLILCLGPLCVCARSPLSLSLSLRRSPRVHVAVRGSFSQEKSRSDGFSLICVLAHAFCAVAQPKAPSRH
jgi:hypothetical protein